MTLQLCTCVPPPPPTCLPSVCEINVVSVWVSAAAFAFLRCHLSQKKGKETCRPQLHASLSSFPVHIHCLCSGNTGSWVGREWCLAEASVALTLFFEGASLGDMGPLLDCGRRCPTPCPPGLGQLSPSCLCLLLVSPLGHLPPLPLGPWNPLIYLCSSLQHPMPVTSLIPSSQGCAQLLPRLSNLLPNLLFP